jgi:hypothetical protein
MVGRRWVAGLAAVGLLVPACTQDDAPAAGDDALGSSPPDAAVLRSYVEALADGNIDLAMELRCRNARQEGESRDEFGAELERLTDALGAPELVRVAENDPPTGVAAWVDGAAEDPEQRCREELDAVELSYWLSFDGVEFDDPQLVVILDEDGERRICGHATHASEHLFEVIDDGISDTELPPVRALSDLMPASVGDNYEQVEDRVSLHEGLPGAVEAYTRAWQHVGEHEGVRVSAFRFSSPAVALAWAGHRARGFAGDAVQQFEVPGLRGAVGVRVSASAWLLRQPTGEPPFLDGVIFVVGNVGAEIAVTQSSADADTSLAVAISHQVADLAGP